MKGEPVKSLQNVILAVTAAAVAALFLLPRLRRLIQRPLRVGGRIRLSGGHALHATWLGGHAYVDAEVVDFLPTGDRRRAALVHLARPLSGSRFSSDVAVLSLRYEDGEWKGHDVVHVELWRTTPVAEELNDSSNANREWLESHAVYRSLEGNGERHKPFALRCLTSI